jgi:5-deoxy-D-glucuronate isomerase
MSTPLSQVIPPGQEAGFDIVFCSQTVKTFSAPITYYINDRPFNFLVTAQADPVSLEISKKKLLFSFNEESTDMSVTQSIMLTNYGNATAYFNWQYQGTVFVPSPQSGEVAAGSSLKVDVTFTPTGPKSDDELMFLKIQDGEAEEMKCSGQVTEARCVFMEKQLNFGNVHVGLEAKDRTIHLKNQLRTPAIFHVHS